MGKRPPLSLPLSPSHSHMVHVGRVQKVRQPSAARNLKAKVSRWQATLLQCGSTALNLPLPGPDSLLLWAGRLFVGHAIKCQTLSGDPYCVILHLCQVSGK